MSDQDDEQDRNEARSKSIGSRFGSDNSDKSDQSDGSERPFRKGKQTLNMYVSPETVKDLDIRFQRLKLEYLDQYGEEIEKNADYYPSILEAAFTNKTVSEVLGLDDGNGNGNGESS